MTVYGVNTPKHRFHRAFLLCLVLWLAMPACQKKCQPPAPERPTSITQNSWRLISTNDPSLKNNNKYTFYVISFAQDFSGDMKKVVNNREFETPVKTLKYNLETDSGKDGLIRIAYFDVSAEEGAEATASGEPTQTTDYDYSLGKNLVLDAKKSGYSYEFVPYVGIVDPDNNCTF